MASASGNFKGRDEYRKAQELEEARKAGLAPAAVDEDGKEINPHIPQFMAAAPWYLNSNGPSLKHQKSWKHGETVNAGWYDRGAKVYQATKFRKGACENCGAMTHKAKDCVERPRTKGAKLTGRDIAPDEKIEKIEMDYEIKHDRYNGYDASEYAKVVERFERVEALQKEKKKEKELERLVRKQQKAKRREAGEAVSDDSDDESDEEEDKVDEAHQTEFGEVKRRVRTAGGGASMSVRNLRIREDTAKYLLNLDVDSAYYDPKTRSMREDPTPNADPATHKYRGDNAYRKTGETQEFEKMTRYAWDAFAKGHEVSLQAAPSQAEALHKEFLEKKAALTSQKKSDVLERYGNAAAAAGDAVPRELLLGQTEAYQEFDRTGRLVRGGEAAVPRSKYEEDVLVNNHTSVFGSWWDGATWGYACCHSCHRNSYCVGAKGIVAEREAAEQMVANLAAKAANKEADDAARAAAYEALQTRKRAQWGGDAAPDVQLDADKLQEALKREEERLARGDEGDRKRAYNSTYSDEVTEEEMEAYRLKRARDFDPAAEKGAGAGTAGYDYV